VENAGSLGLESWRSGGSGGGSRIGRESREQDWSGEEERRGAARDSRVRFARLQPRIYFVYFTHCIIYYWRLCEKALVGYHIREVLPNDQLSQSTLHFEEFSKENLNKCHHFSFLLIARFMIGIRNLIRWTLHSICFPHTKERIKVQNSVSMISFEEELKMTCYFVYLYVLLSHPSLSTKSKIIQ
jgi:hypothetical protein